MEKVNWTTNSSPEKQKDQCPVLNPIPTCASITGCADDSECSEGEKCCLQRDCSRKCYAESKPGQCPSIKRAPCPLILRPDECITDWDCAGELKCCSDGCIKRCSSTFLRENRGMVMSDLSPFHSQDCLKLKFRTNPKFHFAKYLNMNSTVPKYC